MILVLDTENTIWSDGSPFDQRNFNVCISYATEDGEGRCFFSDDEKGREVFSRLLRQSTTLVGFNFKYDLHWLRRLGYDTSGKRVWCCQVAEFALGRQLSPFPGLGETGERRNLGNKISYIEENYWSKGINTDKIPREELGPYAVRDAELTLKIYQQQIKEVQPHQKVLFSLLMQDLLVLEEMEWNGLHFDKELCLRKANELEVEINKLQSELDLFHSVPAFNWASNDHISALLYGGSIVERKRIPVGVFATGKKVGEPRYKIELVEHRLPRRYAPIRGSALKKEGVWSVEEDYLKKLKGADRKLIDGILQIKEWKKLLTTYLLGLPKLHEERHQEPNILHGEFSQVTAKTGRLASAKPNLQNLSEKAQVIFTSRYV